MKTKYLLPPSNKAIKEPYHERDKAYPQTPSSSEEAKYLFGFAAAPRWTIPSAD